MASFNYRPSAVRQEETRAYFDQGLRAHMLRVYNYMASGVLLTGIVAWFSFQQAVVIDSSGAIVGLTSWGQTLFASPLAWVVMLAPLGFVMALSFGVNRMQSSTLQTLFWSFAAVMGPFLGIDFHGLCRQFDCTGLFHHRRGFCRPQSLWLYDTQKPQWFLEHSCLWD